MRWLIVVVAVAAAAPSQARQCEIGKQCGKSCIEWADDCTKEISDEPPTCFVGKPCGNTCINAFLTCHVDEASPPPDHATHADPEVTFWVSMAGICVAGCGLFVGLIVATFGG